MTSKVEMRTSVLLGLPSPSGSDMSSSEDEQIPKPQKVKYFEQYQEPATSSFAPQPAKSLRNNMTAAIAQQPSSSDSSLSPEHSAEMSPDEESSPKSSGSDDTAKDSFMTKKRATMGGAATDEESDYEGDTEISGKETPRIHQRLHEAARNMRPLIIDTSAETPSSHSHQAQELQVEASKPKQQPLDAIDEEQEAEFLREQQEMMAKYPQFWKKKQLEKEREKERELQQEQQSSPTTKEEQDRLEEQLRLMRIEQLQFTRLQQAIAKEAGRPATFRKASIRQRPISAQAASRPTRYLDTGFGDHTTQSSSVVPALPDLSNALQLSVHNLGASSPPKTPERSPNENNMTNVSFGDSTAEGKNKKFSFFRKLYKSDKADSKTKSKAERPQSAGGRFFKRPWSSKKGVAPAMTTDKYIALPKEEVVILEEEEPVLERKESKQAW
mmetsp:Transcript_13559/g.21180  ORF Transcript_13559/g.21180 Transcript_13559/m.21180 type:complete len:441 (-) Transcript_13559:164-1486(-)|eukprot:CAMPEP_0184324528 /NCGR_PEP_ID=MMETSP1049-20130417/135587_1 /TAXON_ID=77928 /ORGANISM="Proteomonas sulcata, Strain CCMP704" /LENGTH=440 /DNA_ID=CAMNT_0026646315 /DNA_START=411 /DNA_END=1733 /DNA_ORIENTATION=-